jgi:hypothetical protein
MDNYMTKIEPMTLDREKLKEAIAARFRECGMEPMDSRLFARDAIAIIEPILTAAERMEQGLTLIAQQRKPVSNSEDKDHEHYLSQVLIEIAKSTLNDVTELYDKSSDSRLN